MYFIMQNSRSLKEAFDFFAQLFTDPKFSAEHGQRKFFVQENLLEFMLMHIFA